jgi:DNA processing protein
MERDEKIYTAALNLIFRYDCRPARELIAITGSAGAVFKLKHDELKDIFGKEYSFIKEIEDNSILDQALDEIKWAERSGIDILFSTDSQGGYPKRLLECQDYPLVIYKRGTSPLDASVIVSIVGTRKSTPYGNEVCSRIISDLAEAGLNPIIVSGLAFGIDITAHKIALEQNLRTVAVLGSSLDTIYPVSHGRYARLIERQGALITEFPRNSLSFKINFIRRNRIIAGMADAIIVVESGLNGGSMITASLASSYSRELFAVPGRLNDARSSGCNILISKNLASLYSGTSDFISHMGWQEYVKKSGSDQDILFTEDKEEKEKILVALASANELNIDEILRITGINIAKISSALLELELQGKVIALPGKRYNLR